MFDKILITPAVRSSMVDHCLQTLPHEACGFLFGAAYGNTIMVKRFAPVPNVAKEPAVRFEMDPASLIPLASRRNDNNNEIIVGIIHSHPLAPAIPSNEDLLTAWHQMPSHWILSLLDLEKPDLQAYRYVADKSDGTRFIPLEWELADNEPQQKNNP